jgi:hypothetical protein
MHIREVILIVWLDTSLLRFPGWFFAVLKAIYMLAYNSLNKGVKGQAYLYSKVSILCMQGCTGTIDFKMKTLRRRVTDRLKSCNQLTTSSDSVTLADMHTEVVQWQMPSQQEECAGWSKSRNGDKTRCYLRHIRLAKHAELSRWDHHVVWQIQRQNFTFWHTRSLLIMNIGKSSQSLFEGKQSRGCT